MNARPAPQRLINADFLGSPKFVNAITALTIGLAACWLPIVRLLGWAGFIAALSTLVVLAVTSGVARRDSLDWQGILPISLIVFVSWCALSLLWSEYQWATLSSLLYQFAFAMLGVYIALTRDVIQIVRIFGNVLRLVLGLSLALEIISGIIVDTAIPLLGIEGNLSSGEPIQGLTGDSTQLGIIALVGGVTFWIEFTTRSMNRRIAVVSLLGAAFMLLLTRSTVLAGAAVLVTIAALVLEGIRRVRPSRRQPLTWALLATATVALIAGFIFRARLLDSVQGSDQLASKLELWTQIGLLVPDNYLEGWGWIGRWRTELVPFVGFGEIRGNGYASAFNSFLDAWLQVGLVGLVILCGLIGLALVRSWHLAVRQPSVVYLWPALILVSLVATSITESAILTDFCWLALVICVVKSANKLSWRLAFARSVSSTDLPRQGR